MNRRIAHSTKIVALSFLSSGYVFFTQPLFRQLPLPKEQLLSNPLYAAKLALIWSLVIVPLLGCIFVLRTHTLKTKYKALIFVIPLLCLIYVAVMMNTNANIDSNQSFEWLETLGVWWVACAYALTLNHLLLICVKRLEAKYLHAMIFVTVWTIISVLFASISSFT